MDHQQQPRVLGGRYRIEALIGRGGMSDVYRGTDELLDRPVAIKILTDRSEDVRKRFLREAQSMARLNHPNIVGVHDAIHADGVSFIVMELVAGRTLATISPDSRLTTDKRWGFQPEVPTSACLLSGSGTMLSGRSVRRTCLPTGEMVQPLGNRKPFSLWPGHSGLGS